jgi:hypothetical protein
MTDKLDPSLIADPSIPPKCIIHREKIGDLEHKLDRLASADNYRHDEVEKLCAKIDQTMQKLQELTVSITKMVALHDNRIQHVEKSAEAAHQMFIEQTEKFIANDTITKQNSKDVKGIIDKLGKIEKRIVVVEIWRWMILGAGALILWGLTYLLPHLLEHFQVMLENKD